MKRVHVSEALGYLAAICQEWWEIMKGHRFSSMLHCSCRIYRVDEAEPQKCLTDHRQTKQSQIEGHLSKLINYGGMKSLGPVGLWRKRGWLIPKLLLFSPSAFGSGVLLGSSNSAAWWP